MAIRIIPHADEHSAAVHAFNLRMRAGGTHWGFYPDPLPDWIPKRRADQPVWREYHLAVEDDGTVRGAFALKPQPWLVAGQEAVVADWQGPFSEGAVDPKFSMLALRMMRHMLKQYPLLYSWGHGAEESALLTILQKMGWWIHSTPLCLRVVNGRRFLRLNGYLRRKPMHRVAQDAAAFSGLGTIGFVAAHAALRLRSPGLHRVSTDPVSTFGAWTDDVWEQNKGKYVAVGCRDAQSMNTLVPEKGWPPAVRLRMRHGGRCTGWALVLDTQMIEDKRFGNLRVGSVIDCFADPADAARVIAGATSYLIERGVDLIVSNQAHAQWVQAFAHNGYVVMKGRRDFAASPDLCARLQPVTDNAAGLHLTNMDGHGPHSL